MGASEARMGTMYDRTTIRTSYNSAATSVYEEVDEDVELIHLELVYEEVYFIKTFTRELGTQNTKEQIMFGVKNGNILMLSFDNADNLVISAYRSDDEEHENIES